MKDIFIDEDFNCRGHFNKIDVAELATDIEKQTPIIQETMGLIQPVTVRILTGPEIVKCGKAYGLVAGFRRYFAFEVLKRTEIPCNVIQGITPAQAAIINLAENIKRKDLNILQEANALAKLHAASIPRDTVARELGVSSGWVQTRFNLLDLPEDIQKEAASGLINQKQIKEIWSLKSTEKQYEAVRKIKDAKIKGERAADIEIKKPKDDPTKPKVRQRTEIFAMMKHIAGILGYGFYSRVQSWDSGELATLDLLKELKVLADEKGVSYTVPPTGTIFNGE